MGKFFLFFHLEHIHLFPCFLSFCICFCELDETYTSLNLGGMALCRYRVHRGHAGGSGRLTGADVGMCSTRATLAGEQAEARVSTS